MAAALARSPRYAIRWSPHDIVQQTAPSPRTPGHGGVGAVGGLATRVSGTDGIASVAGECEARFVRVRTMFEDSFVEHPARDPPEWGASLAAVGDGRTVLHLWGGWIDSEKERPWREDSVTGIFSCRKSLTALALHVAVDRGLLDYDDSVATWWPEFGQRGKEGVTLRHVLAHQSGLPQIGLSGVPGSIADVVASIEALEPQWAPGTDIGYSATFDPILQEVLERVLGESLDGWFRREIAEPCQADVFLAIGDADGDRVAPWISPKGEEWGVQGWWPENGYAGALGLARIFGSLVGADEAQDLLLSGSTLDRALEVQATGVDRTNGLARSYRLGWRKSVGMGDVQIGSNGFGSPGGLARWCGQILTTTSDLATYATCASLRNLNTEQTGCSERSSISLIPLDDDSNFSADGSRSAPLHRVASDSAGACCGSPASRRPIGASSLAAEVRCCRLCRVSSTARRFHSNQDRTGRPATPSFFACPSVPSSERSWSSSSEWS